MNRITRATLLLTVFVSLYAPALSQQLKVERMDEWLYSYDQRYQHERWRREGCLVTVGSDFVMITSIGYDREGYRYVQELIFFEEGKPIVDDEMRYAPQGCKQSDLLTRDKPGFVDVLERDHLESIKTLPPRATRFFKGRYGIN